MGGVHDARVNATTRDRVEALYREQGARLWRSVFAVTGDREVANDSVAEAFAQLLSRGGDVRNPAAWIWKAAFRIAAGELKQRGRRPETATPGQYEMGEPLILVSALARISPKQRAAIVLHHYAGYSARETASIIGSTTAAVKVHLSQGRKRLQAILSERDDG
jgi:RNA polymerase sigma factor (sigma-70 family)